LSACMVDLLIVWPAWLTCLSCGLHG